VPAGCRRRSTEAHELVVVQASTGVTLDPHRHHDMPTLSVLSNCYESLVAFGLDMDLVPQLATGWESISDRETRLQVRRGVSFHDGRPLSAADVVASLKRSLAMPRLGFDPQLKQVEDVRALNDHTVAIVTRQPSPLLLNDLVFVSILPADTPLEPVAKVVGTGPYKMTSGSAGGELSLERFDRYWGTAPEFDRVRLVPVADDESGRRAWPAAKPTWWLSRRRIGRSDPTPPASGS